MILIYKVIAEHQYSEKSFVSIIGRFTSFDEANNLKIKEELQCGLFTVNCWKHYVQVTEDERKLGVRDRRQNEKTNTSS